MTHQNDVAHGHEKDRVDALPEIVAWMASSVWGDRANG